jgi:hypothetical protein
MSASETPEYCIIMPLQPMTVGCWIDRSQWPHHVTVCPEFHSGPQDIDALAAVLRRVAATTSPPSASIGEEAHFGPNGETIVQLVESNDLHRLHVTLMEALGAVARVESLVPEYNSAGFRPHMTVIEGSQLGRGSSLSLGTLLLVEIAPDGDRSMAVPVATATVGVSVNDESVSAERAAGAWSMLDGEGIHSLVIGGWGVDALVGRQTRDHHDLDLLVLDEAVGSMLKFLETMGSGPQYLWSENRWHDRLPSAFVAELAGIEVDVHAQGPILTRRAAHKWNHHRDVSGHYLGRL